MKRLCAFLFLSLIGWSAGVSAQAAMPLPLNRQPPALALVILLDDTRTMTNQNSASAGGKHAVNAGTDPDDTRAESVEEIAALLHADQTQTHLLAVYSFRSDTGDWLTKSGDDKFITLGGDNVADSQHNLDALASALSHRKFETIRGGGQTTLAVNAAYEALNQTFGNFASLPAQLVTVLITDDVPITDFGISPWSQGAVPNWINGDVAGFRSALGQLAAMPQYKDSTCLHADGHPAFVVFPMGAANWVKSDGNINENPTGLEQDSFFYNLARHKLDGSPLLYPIAPQFGSTEQMRQEFHNQVAQFINEIRCDWTSEAAPVSNALGSTQQDYIVEMSNLYPYVRLTIDTQGSNVQIFDAAAASPVDENTPGVRVAPVAGGLQIWSLARDTYPGAWQGKWIVRVTGSARVLVTADIQPSELTWKAETPQVTQGEAIDYHLTLMAGDKIVSPSQAFTLTLHMRDTSSGGMNDYTLEPGANDFGVNISGDAITGSNYEFQPLITFNEAWGQTIAANQPYFIGNPASIGIESSPGMTVVAPGEHEVWCRDGKQNFAVRLAGFDNLQGDADPASLFSYSEVQLLYTPPAPLNAGTPVPNAPILLNPIPTEGIFAVTLDCDSQLLRGAQVVVIRGQLADQITYEQTRAGVYDAPTTPPTSTPSPTFTPMLTTLPPPSPAAIIPLPTPQRVDVVTGIINPLTQPPLSTILVAVVGVLLVSGIILAFRNYRNTYLPLTFVSIERKFDSTPRALLTGWRALLPFTQQKTIYEDDADRLLTVTRDEKGRFVYVLNTDLVTPEKLSESASDLVAEVPKSVAYKFSVPQAEKVGGDPARPEARASAQAHAEIIVLKPTNEVSDTPYWYRIAPFFLLGSALFTVQRLDAQGKPYSGREALNRWLPRANRYAILSPERHSLALFTVRWSRYDQTLQIEAGQSLRINDVQVSTGDVEVSYQQETSIVVNAPREEIRIFNRRASQQI